MHKGLFFNLMLRNEIKLQRNFQINTNKHNNESITAINPPNEMNNTCMQKGETQKEKRRNL